MAEADVVLRAPYDGGGAHTREEDKVYSTTKLYKARRPRRFVEVPTWFVFGVSFLVVLAAVCSVLTLAYVYADVRP